MSIERFSLVGKTALVTGASSGLGHGIAKGLAEAGANVIAAARRTDKLARLVDELTSAGHNAVAVALDVTDRESVIRAYDCAEARFGCVDIIINNAGVVDAKNVMKIDSYSLDFVMNTNFKGAWHVAQEGARRLITAQRPGSIVNMASTLGFSVLPGQANYCASKGAVIQMTRSMAIDLMRHNIRVNAIAPGSIKTEINAEFYESDAGRAYVAQLPAKRIGEVDEILGPVILLASDAASYINGTVLPVDGAHHVRLI